MLDEDLSRLIISLKNLSLKQLESADSYELVFLEESTSYVISVRRDVYEDILRRNADIKSFYLSTEPYLISGYRFLK